MRYLSESVDKLKHETSTSDPVHEAVVIGSGYGGSVAALRLAERGIKVVVLERGQEYLSGEFPGGLGQLINMVRIDRSGMSRTAGLESALFDIRMGDNIGALVGSALGGTSQINANVLAIPDADTFDRLDEQDHRLWPSDVTLEALEPYFQVATHDLGGEPFSRTFLGFKDDSNSAENNALEACSLLGVPKKTEALQKLADNIRTAGFDAKFEAARITVRLGDENTVGNWDGTRWQLNPGICVGCGECVAGCNFNAKKTLTHTYLPRAKACGARFFTGVTVLRLEKHHDATWRVFFQATHDRKDARTGVEVPEHVLRARQVIVSAGTLGSTEILMRSQAASAPTSLKFSRALGSSLSTNGDSLAAAFMTPEVVNGVGTGEAEYAADGAGVGPTITGSIRVQRGAGLEEPLLIQDAAIPRALAGVAHELISTLGTLAQLPLPRADPLFPADGRPFQDWASLSPAALHHTQLLLIMGHDRAGGSMQLDPVTGRLNIKYRAQDAEQQGKIDAAVLACVESAGGLLLPNPALGFLPKSIAGMLHGAKPSAAAFTVHPLGGCRMAEEACGGVVDSFGRVFDPAWDGTKSTPRHHAGLMVLDGSIIPASIGVNPLLTITAVAERAMAKFIADTWDGAGAKTAIQRTAVPLPPLLDQKTHASAQRNIPVRFTESLRSRDFIWQGPGNKTPTKASAHLLLHLPLPSLESFAADASHTVLIPASGTITPSLARPHEDRAALRIDFRPDEASTHPAGLRTVPHPRLATLEVVDGSVSLLPATQERDAWLRVLFTCLKLRFFRDGFPTGASPSVRQEKDKPKPALGIYNTLDHARERREMVYQIQLRSAVRDPGSSDHFVLVGRKRLGYAASWAQLIHGIWPGRRLQRPGPWADLGTMYATIYDMTGTAVGTGIFTLDMIDMTRRYVPQLGSRGNTPDALSKLAGYPLWMLRILLKTRFWDFRLPDPPRFVPCELNAYSAQPTHAIPGRTPLPPSSCNHSPTFWPHRFPDLVVRDRASHALRRIAAEPHVSLRVPRARGAAELIELRLIRYRQDPVCSTPGRVRQTTQFRSMLMLNGFAQSTLPLVAQELKRHKDDPSQDDVNLATFFYEQGFDIWLFEYRTSSVLEASKLPCTLDDIAAIDVPSAVNHILKALQPEGSSRAQIYAYGHCVGAAALVMSMLGGYLQHESDGKDDADAPPSKLAGVIFSQMQAYTIGSVSAQARFAFGALARDALGIEYFRLSAAERSSDAMESMLDRFFASLPVDAGEECPLTRMWEEEHGDECTCKRMSGIISRLFRHDRILKQTHRRLPAYFGRANTSLMVHASRCMEAERLVDSDGQNVYVTDANITRHLNLPVALLHGRHNAVLDVESTLRTHEALVRLNPHLDGAGVCMKIIANDFAHFDTTVGHGREMREQILQPFEKFLRRAWDYNAGPPARQPSNTTIPNTALTLQAPLSGPLIGWVRPGRSGNKQGYMVRMWIEVDQAGDSAATHALVRLESDPGRLVPIWRVPVNSNIIDTRRLRHWRRTPPRGTGYIAVAVADVFVDTQRLSADRPVEIFMASVHNLITADLHAMHAVPRNHLPAEVSDNLRDALIRREEMRDRLARSADPGTISRVRRTLSLAGKESGVARLYRRTLVGTQGQPSSFICASCRHPGTPFDRQRADDTLNDIADRITNGEINPRFMLMLGDQIYADATAGVMDSPSPVEKVLLGSRRAFGSTGFRRVVTKLPTYMVMDDHEIDDSWSEDKLRAPAGQRLEQAERLRDVGFAAFGAFQWLHSPRLAAPRGRTRQGRFWPGRFGYAFEMDDAAFFVLDTRSHRDRRPKPSGSDPVICTPAQLEELQHWLETHPATVKFIVTGSVIVPGLRQHFSDMDELSVGAEDNWQLARPQRIELLNMIANCPTSNIVLLSGDYHCAAVSTMTFKHKPDKRTYAIASPPLYAPFPALNVHPLDLTNDPRGTSESETIALDADHDVKVCTRAWQGDGYMEISFVQQANQRWLRAVAELTLLDSAKAPEARHHELFLPLA